jgi:hypothetical protein
MVNFALLATLLLADVGALCVFDVFNALLR